MEKLEEWDQSLKKDESLSTLIMTVKSPQFFRPESGQQRQTELDLATDRLKVLRNGKNRYQQVVIPRITSVPQAKRVITTPMQTNSI